MGEAVDKLAGLLHDREVSGEIRVEHIVKADLLERGDHALVGGVLGVEVVVLSPRRAHGGRHLHDGDLLGIGQRVEDLAGVVVLLQRADGTVCHALTAERAVRLAELARFAHADGRARTGAHQIPDSHTLDLLADLDAAHALDAAVLNADDGVAEVVGDVVEILNVVLAEEVIVVAELLELAVAAAGTLCAVRVVLAQQQAQVHAARLAHAGGVRRDDHPLHDGVVAGGDKALIALDLDHAQAACADFVDALEIAERGNVEVDGAGGLEDGRTLRHRDGFAVDCQRYHLLFRPPLKIP